MPYLPIKGYEGLYEIDEHGSVRSIDRNVIGKDGNTYLFKGRILKPSQNKNVEYLQISLWKNGIGTSYYIHRLVGLAHIPNPNNLPEINHKDGNRLYNYFKNLEWVTSSENSFHAVSIGLRVYNSRMTEEEWFECLCDVINGESYGGLSQRTPYKVPNLSIRIRKLARKLGLEPDLDQSLYEQKVERARTNGVKNTGKNRVY